MGLTFGLAIFLIGAGAVHWAKKLMYDVEVVQQRHAMNTDEDETAGGGRHLRGRQDARVSREYPMIRRTMLAAMALVPIPFIVSLRDLWLTPPGVTTPSEELLTTLWKPGMRMVTDITYQPVKADEIPVGGLVNVVPADLPWSRRKTDNLNARAKAAAILVRMTPEEIQSQQGEGWDYQGILSFSKICTHVGCPISLYQQRTHELLCPCHQSTFNLSDSANVVFGPAARRMPQLPITVDDEGYLVAVSDFKEPVGPSFWELKEELLMSTSELRQSRYEEKGAGAANYLDERLGSNGFLRRNLNKVFPDHWSFMLGEVALYSFIVVLLSGVYLTLFFKPTHGRGHLRRPLHPAQGRHDVRGVRLGTEHLLRDPRRPADASDPPLGGAVLHDRDRGPHVPGVLHRGVPQAPRDELDDRRRPGDDLADGGLLRLLAARRPAVRHRPADRRRHRVVDPRGRYLGELPDVRRGVPRHRLHLPPLRHPHPADPGDPAGA